MAAEPNPVVEASPAPKRGMSRTQKILFFVVGWLIVLMPFLFWWNTWFGRHLSDQQLNEYLHDDKKPRHIQQALVQVEERITGHDNAVKQWYPDLLRLGANPVEEVRNTDAWVMGQDTSGTGFHDTLLKMLNDPSPMVRGNAALSLVRFGDATGRPQIVALLQQSHITAPQAGRIVDADRPGTAIHQGGLIAKLAVIDSSHPGSNSTTIEIRSPIPGRIRSVSQTGANVAAGAEVAVVDPGSEQVWKLCEHCIWWGRWKTFPQSRLMNAIFLIFPMTCASRRLKLKRRYAREQGSIKLLSFRAQRGICFSLLR